MAQEDGAPGAAQIEWTFEFQVSGWLPVASWNPREFSIGAAHLRAAVGEIT